MRRLCTELPFTCVTCELEIRGKPIFHVGLPFCCAGCVADGPCTCSYDDPIATEARIGAAEAPMVEPISADVHEVLASAAR